MIIFGRYYSHLFPLYYSHFILPLLWITLVRLVYIQSEPCKFTLIHSDKIPSWGIHFRAILRFSSAVEIGGSDVELTGRTAFPPRQMEKETRLMEEDR